MSNHMILECDVCGRTADGRNLTLAQGSWGSVSGIGIEFQDLCPECTEKVERFVRKLKEESA